MIVKLFQPRFAPLVESGQKRQTIRPRPKRMPKVGDNVSLREWTGRPSWSKQRVLRESVIIKVVEVTISLSSFNVIIDGKEPSLVDVIRLSKAEGFNSWLDMRDWFRKTYGLPFDGILIQWRV